MCCRFSVGTFSSECSRRHMRPEFVHFQAVMQTQSQSSATWDERYLRGLHFSRKRRHAPASTEPLRLVARVAAPRRALPKCQQGAGPPQVKRVSDLVPKARLVECVDVLLLQLQRHPTLCENKLGDVLLGLAAPRNIHLSPRWVTWPSCRAAMDRGPKTASWWRLRGREWNVGTGARASAVATCTSRPSACHDDFSAEPRCKHLEALRQVLQRLRLLLTHTTSPVWLVHEVAHLNQFSHHSFAQIDSCVFGTRWRRTSRLLRGFCDPYDCVALNKRFCVYSRRQHVQLSCTLPGSTTKVIVAQTNPPTLARKLATAALDRL